MRVHELSAVPLGNVDACSALFRLRKTPGAASNPPVPDSASFFATCQIFAPNGWDFRMSWKLGPVGHFSVAVIDPEASARWWEEKIGVERHFDSTRA